MIHGLVPTLAEGGKIKIGGLGAEITSRKGTRFRPPEKYDHFVVTHTDRDDAGDLAVNEPLMSALRALSREADGEVREIPIVLHSDEIDEVFPTSYAMYGNKRRICHGDGRTATRSVCNDRLEPVGKTPEHPDGTFRVPCTCAYLGAPGTPTCKPHGTLHCSVAVPGFAVLGSVHKFRTTSLITIQRLIGSLLGIRNRVGGFAGIPLWLVLEPVKVTPVGAPASTVYVCHVELRETDVTAVQRRAIEARQMRALVAGDQVVEYKQLVAPPAADDESEAEQAAVQAEFHPDPADVAEAQAAATETATAAKLGRVGKALARKTGAASPSGATAGRPDPETNPTVPEGVAATPKTPPDPTAPVRAPRPQAPAEPQGSTVPSRPPPADSTPAGAPAGATPSPASRRAARAAPEPTPAPTGPAGVLADGRPQDAPRPGPEATPAEMGAYLLPEEADRAPETDPEAPAPAQGQAPVALPPAGPATATASPPVQPAAKVHDLAAMVGYLRTVAAAKGMGADDDLEHTAQAVLGTSWADAQAGGRDPLKRMYEWLSAQPNRAAARA